ncbi:MAG: RHS repeat-associated core domain-containing protein, partial [Verrucomicrobiales bacterium]|nr:RHS repeat-associated core domain-containing protein [Verrucomicrobiales bacterium]
PGLNPVRFSGKYTDAETGLCYYGLRFYEPEKGGWLSRDPIGIRGGLNLYGMVGNDPVNWIDHLGLLNKFTGKCEVVLFIGHNNGDIEGALGEWNALHQAVLKEEPADPSQASALACSLPKWDNKPYGIPNFVGSGNGLIGWGDTGKSSNGGMTPEDDPNSDFDNDRASREAFGFLKLVLTNYHASLLSADAFAEQRLGCCPEGITMRLYYYSDIVPRDPVVPYRPFGATTFNGAVDHLGRIHPFA